MKTAEERGLDRKELIRGQEERGGHKRWEEEVVDALVG
jgi:hypothetical protein